MPAAIEWFFPFHEIIEKMRWQVRQIRQGIAAAFLQLFGRQCNVDDFLLKGHRAAEMHAAIVQEQQYIMA